MSWCACRRVEVDCCKRHPTDCRTVLHYDADGSPDVRVCAAGHGCGSREHHARERCGVCGCAQVAVTQ